MLLPEPERPLTSINCTATLFFLLHLLLLPGEELLRRIDAAQLEDFVAHRGLDQHREVAPGGHRDDHLADGDAEDLLGELGERQALGRVARRRAAASPGA